ncbi:hypothetical protein FDZ71_11925, partial [bacterium]
MNRIVICLVLLAMTGLLPSRGAAAPTTVLKEVKVREAVTGFIMERTAGSGMDIRIVSIGYGGDLTVP